MRLDFAMQAVQNAQITQSILFCGLLLIASVWDLKTRVIPDFISVFLLLTAVLHFKPNNLCGVLIALPMLIAALIHEGGMGGGDFKLTGACGAVLGVSAGTFGLILALCGVLVYYFAAKTIKKRAAGITLKSGHTSLPLAPFLSFGFIAAYFMKYGGLFL